MREQDAGSIKHSPWLLEEYVSIARRRPQNSLSETALRTRSLEARHLLAYAASGGALSLSGLLAAARANHPRRELLGRVRIDPRFLTDLARVIALQDILIEDKSDGLLLYDFALKLFGPAEIRPDHQGVHAQLAYELGQLSKALALLRTYPAVPEQVRSDLILDLANPFTGSTPHRGAGWLSSFQSLFPRPHPTITGYEVSSPFDRLTAPAAKKSAATDRITVIVTAFRPGSELVTAVRSLINQSWEDLEILLVDDGSPPEFDAILHQCCELDQRVRLIKLDANVGTYVARNIGLDAAAGRFVTFQDSDDWSHPRRLERQVEPLLHDASVVATISDGLRVTENLVITKPGRNPRVLNTSSLMLRKDAVVSRVGYFDSLRKAADSEYVKRIEAAHGTQAVRRLRGELLALIRLSPDSLSRAEIRAGWMDPARVAYRSAYESWHERIRDGKVSPYVPRNLAYRPFFAPERLKAAASNPSTARRYDVAFVTDWRWLGDTQQSMLEEIGVLTGSGMRVAVLHMESLLYMTPYRKPLCRPVQELVNDGVVDQILYSDSVEVTLLLVGEPSVLEFPPAESSQVSAARTLIVADTAPRTADAGVRRYTPDLCTKVAKGLFGVEPQWCPRGYGVRESLAAEVTTSELTRFELPRVINPMTLNLVRDRFRSHRPVIGRWARDHRSTWPSDPESLLQVYPDTDDVDVRIVGGADAALAVLGRNSMPSNWIVYRDDEVSIRSFMFQIDFYVYFPGSDTTDEIGNAVIDALAAGCVVILPEQFSQSFGNAAVYCQPAETQRIIQRFYGDRNLFLDQSRRAKQWARRYCDPVAYLRRIQELTGWRSLQATGR